MTDKELRRLSRSELMELLITQMEENEALRGDGGGDSLPAPGKQMSMLMTQMEENERLKRQLAEAEKSLSQREISIANSGSIAEAALQVNGVFEAAQQAADQYLDNIRRLNEEQQALCQKLEEESRQKAADIISEAERYSKRTHAQADAYWREISQKAQALLQAQEQAQNSLRSLIQPMAGEQPV